MISNDVVNEMIRQKDYIYNVLNQGLPVQAGALLEFVKPFWILCDYEYKYNELYARIWGEGGF